MRKNHAHVWNPLRDKFVETYLNHDNVYHRGFVVDLVRTTGKIKKADGSTATYPAVSKVKFISKENHNKFKDGKLTQEELNKRTLLIPVSKIKSVETYNPLGQRAYVYPVKKSAKKKLP